MNPDNHCCSGASNSALWGCHFPTNLGQLTINEFATSEKLKWLGNEGCFAILPIFNKRADATSICKITCFDAVELDWRNTSCECISSFGHQIVFSFDSSLHLQCGGMTSSILITEFNAQ
jgi:hypothetical protein